MLLALGCWIRRSCQKPARRTPWTGVMTVRSHGSYSSFFDRSLLKAAEATGTFVQLEGLESIYIYIYRGVSLNGETESKKTSQKNLPSSLTAKP